MNINYIEVSAVCVRDLDDDDDEETETGMENEELKLVIFV